MNNVYLLFESAIKNIPESSIIGKKTHDNCVDYLQLLTNLASYLYIETPGLFNQKMEVKCSFEKGKWEQFSYILLTPSKSNKNDGSFYIPVIFDFEKQHISISLTYMEHKPDSTDISEIRSYAETHSFPNGIAKISEYCTNPIKANIPEKGIFASQIYSKDRFLDESSFYAYLKDIADLCNMSGNKNEN
ncbi:MAG: hypothetical protein IKZ86_08295 [Spirochaetaceae bacterium]|nr:hypothetical protein [Spirochaetaceae bacterium]